MKIDVVEGHLYENWRGDIEFGLYDEYADAAEELPDYVIGTPEEKEAYETYEVVYQTADGKIFLNPDTAQKHNDSLDIPELNEVLELLEKAKVLCHVSKDKAPALARIQDVLDKIDGDGGSSLMDKYYDSTC